MLNSIKSFTAQLMLSNEKGDALRLKVGEKVKAKVLKVYAQKVTLNLQGKLLTANIGSSDIPLREGAEQTFVYSGLSKSGEMVFKPGDSLKVNDKQEHQALDRVLTELNLPKSQQAREIVQKMMELRVNLNRNDIQKVANLLPTKGENKEMLHRLVSLIKVGASLSKDNVEIMRIDVGQNMAENMESLQQVATNLNKRNNSINLSNISKEINKFIKENKVVIENKQSIAPKIKEFVSQPKVENVFKTLTKVASQRHMPAETSLKNVEVSLEHNRGFVEVKSHNLLSIKTGFESFRPLFSSEGLTQQSQLPEQSFIKNIILPNNLLESKQVELKPHENLTEKSQIFVSELEEKQIVRPIVGMARNFATMDVQLLANSSDTHNYNLTIDVPIEHKGKLHMANINIKQEKKASKDSHDTGKTFITVNVKTKNLGDVVSKLDIHKNNLNCIFEVEDSKTVDMLKGEFYRLHEMLDDEFKVINIDAKLKAKDEVIPREKSDNIKLNKLDIRV
ncbi:hypothetical protein PRVXT_001525 [Proteinivorax tanatarense]|uniref:Flagellar hook-length control protein FliK n=1 Tax=Proteinivorax tanatarense TaxID=1260629 RepID=A0AAU7VQJ9_9FIRM